MAKKKKRVDELKYTEEAGPGKQWRWHLKSWIRSHSSEPHRKPGSGRAGDTDSGFSATAVTKATTATSPLQSQTQGTPAPLPTAAVAMILITLNVATAPDPSSSSHPPSPPTAVGPGDPRHGGETCHGGDLGRNVGSNKVPASPKAKQWQGHQTLPLAEAGDGGKCQFSL